MINENRIYSGFDIGRFILIILIICGVYYPALQGAFVYDDQETIVKNPYIKDLKLIPAYFHPANTEVWSVHPGQRQFYRPLPLVSFALNYEISGLSPKIYHLTNVFFHVVVSVLLLLFIRITHRALAPIEEEPPAIGTTALLAVLIFALHPLQTESVTYIVSRSVVICSIFILAGLLAHLISLTTGSKNPSQWRILGAACFMLALLSKETAIVFPLLLMSMLWSFAKTHHHHTPVRFLLFHSFPYLVLLALYLAIRISFIGQAAMTTIGQHSLLYFLTASKALFIYLRLIFFPAGQNIDHHLPIAGSLAEPSGIIAGIAVICLFFLVVRISLKKPGFSAFWFSWFFLSILPNLILPTNETISEHSAYLPSMGVTTLCVYAFVYFTRKGFSLDQHVRKLVLAVLAAIILVQLSFLTLQRNLIWKDPISLWTDTLVKNPYSDRAMNNLGLAYFQKGKFVKAQQLFLQAVAHKGDSVEAINNLGIIYGLQGKNLQAVNMFRKALSFNPTHADALNNLGISYLHNQAYREAIEIFTQTRRINPETPDISCNLGLAYVHQTQKDKGCRLIRECVRFNPDSPRALSLFEKFCR